MPSHPDRVRRNYPDEPPATEQDPVPEPTSPNDQQREAALNRWTEIALTALEIRSPEGRWSWWGS